MEQLFQGAIDHECDAMLVCGDIYDKMTTLWGDEKDLFIEILGKYDSKIPIVIINGQHDIVVETQMTHLSVLKTLEDSGVLTSTHVVEFKPKVVPIGNWDILAIPFGEYTTIELSDVVFGLMKKVRNPNRVVGMFHGMLQGSFNDMGKQFEGGVTLPSSVRYWALGDIHKRQKMDKISWYSGSPIQNNFGDIETDRGYLLVSIGKRLRIEKKNLVNIKKLINVDLDAGEEIPEDAYVKLSYTRQDTVLNKKTLPKSVIATVSKTQKVVDDFNFDSDVTEVSEILKDVILKLQYPEETMKKSLEVFSKIMELEG